METQNFTNYRRIITGYQRVLYPVLVLGLLISLYNIKIQWSVGGIVSSCLIVLLFICGLIIAYFTMYFALKAEEQAIRAEESLRYYILTGKPLPGKLQINQLKALRSAEDDEYGLLVNQTVKENLQPEDIKKLINHYRAEYQSV